MWIISKLFNNSGYTILFGRMLVQIRKKRGPNIHPCGIQDKILKKVMYILTVYHFL